METVTVGTGSQAQRPMSKADIHMIKGEKQLWQVVLYLGVAPPTHANKLMYSKCKLKGRERYQGPSMF